MQPGFSNRETGKAPPKQYPPDMPRRVQHFYSQLSDDQKRRLFQIFGSEDWTPDEQLIRKLEMALHETTGLMAQQRDRFIVVSGGRDWLTGVKVDAL